MTINNVNNVPEYAIEKNFWVVNNCDNELWFYGAYESEDKAYDVADKIDGQLVYNY